MDAPNEKVVSIPRILLALGVLTVAAGLVFHDDFVAGTVFSALRLPLAALGAALAAGFARKRKALLAGVAGVLGLVALGDLAVERAAAARPGELDDGRRLTVLTWNLLYDGGDPARSLAALGKADADVMAFQEVSPAWATRLGAALAGRFPYAESRPQDGSWGISLYSKRPIRAVEYLEKAPGRPFSQCADLVWGTRAVLLCNDHLMSPGVALAKRSLLALEENEAERTREWETLDRYVATRAKAGEPVVLAGDFNTMVSDPLHRSIEREFVDSWAATHDLPGPTWPNLPIALPVFRIDYVWLRSCKPLAVHRIEESGSDHLGVIAELAL